MSGVVSWAGGALGSAANWAGGAVNSVGDWAGGNSTNPGALGTGEFGVNGANQGLYNSPLGNQAGNWQASQNQLQGYANMAAPTAQNTQLGPAAQAQGPNLGQYNQTFNSQQALANQYAQMAAGQGPSLAAVQAQQQGQQNLQAQLAAQGAAAGQGGSPALAGYNIANQAGNIANQTNQQAVMGRTAEEMGAMGAQAGLYGSMQGGALNAAGMGMANNQFNAGQLNQFGLQQGQMNQQTAMANLQSQSGQNQLNAQELNQANQNYNTQIGNQYQGQLQQAQGQITSQGQQAGAYQSAAQQRSGQLSGLLGAVGGLAMLSDERAKVVNPDKKQVNEFLDNLHAYQFQYKDPAFGVGDRVGIMAQDLEKSALGRQFVSDTPSGLKMVKDNGNLLGTIFASTARINERLKKLEKGKK